MAERDARYGSLTPEQVAFYDTEGYLVLEGLLTQADLAPVRQAMMHKVDLIAEALYRDGLIPHKYEDEPFVARLARLFEGKSDQAFLTYGRSWRDRLPGYFVFMSNPKIVDAIESLLGPEIFANPVYNVRPKVPGVAAGAVPWHQDKSYWPGANANPVITVWVPIVDATHENGCLHIIPRTHRKRLLSHHAENATGTGYLETDAEHVAGYEKREILPLPVKAGTPILFNDRLLHMSTPNRERTVRWSVDLRYQPTDQDPMPQHGAGFLVRSRSHPGRLATLEDWLANRPEHAA